MAGFALGPLGWGQHGCPRVWALVCECGVSLWLQLPKTLKGNGQEQGPGVDSCFLQPSHVGRGNTRNK